MSLALGGTVRHLAPGAWIGVDLDGTLAVYHGWQGVDQIGDPIPAMVDRVRDALDRGLDVRIVTARVCARQTGPDRITARLTIDRWCETHLGRVLPVTDAKDFRMVELWDDRAVQVVPNTGETLQDQLADARAEIARLRARVPADAALSAGEKSQIIAELSADLVNAGLVETAPGVWLYGTPPLPPPVPVDPLQTPETDVTAADAHRAEVEEALATLDALRETPEVLFAAPTIEGVRETIVQTQRVTANQQAVIANLQRVVERKAADAWKDKDRGAGWGRRYEGR